MATNLVSSAIVHNVLTKYNYANWSICMKSYLLGQDLWDVVQTELRVAYNDPDFKTWKKKNYMALHAIQISCGPEILVHMRTITSAKRAWDFLADMRKKPLQEVNGPGSSSRDIGSTSREIESPSRDAGSPSPSDAGSPSPYPGMENRDYLRCLPILKAIESGHFDRAEFIGLVGEFRETEITYSGKTALHVATIAGHVKIVEELVQLMTAGELAATDKDGCTALSAAASSGITEMAILMVGKNRRLTGIKDKRGRSPLIIASGEGHRDMARYLFYQSYRDSLQISTDCGATLVSHCIVAKIFDIALLVLDHVSGAAFASNDAGISPVYVLSQMPTAFPSGNRLVFWQQWIYSCIRAPSFPEYEQMRERIRQGMRVGGELFYEGDRYRSVEEWIDQRFLIPVRSRGLVSRILDLFGIRQICFEKSIHAQAVALLDRICWQIKFRDEKVLAEGLVHGSIFQAVKFGIVEFVIKIINSNPDLVWSMDPNSRDMFFFAIEYRQEKIFSLLYGLGARKEVISSRRDNLNNNMLHLAGMLAPASQLARISGAALQMQRELQWFKEVEQIVQPSYKEARNADGKTPWELFTENHKDLVKEGEKWMKGTATSCTVVAALIVTIMFAAAITVPGGNIQETGTPIFFGNNWYNVFVISDVISFFSSSTSVLTFLGILTSRFAEDDFLKSLPRKMIIGLSALFICIASMMIAFSATLFIMLDGRSKGLGYLVISLASVPVVLFILLQFPLLVEIFMSTYGPSIFDRKTKSWIGQKRVGSVRSSFNSVWNKCFPKSWIQKRVGSVRSSFNSLWTKCFPKSWIQKRVGSVRSSFNSLWTKCFPKSWIGQKSEESNQTGEERVVSA